MGMKTFPGLETHERMKEPRIPDIHLGSLDQALAQVFVPRRQLPNHEGAGQNIKVMLRSRMRRPQGRGYFRCVPGLSVVVGEHPPESSQRSRRNTDSPLGDIALEERLQKIFSPRKALRKTGGQIGG